MPDPIGLAAYMVLFRVPPRSRDGFRRPTLGSDFDPWSTLKGSFEGMLGPRCIPIVSHEDPDDPTQRIVDMAVRVQGHQWRVDKSARVLAGVVEIGKPGKRLTVYDLKKEQESGHIDPKMMVLYPYFFKLYFIDNAEGGILLAERRGGVCARFAVTKLLEHFYDSQATVKIVPAVEKDVLKRLNDKGSVSEIIVANSGQHVESRKARERSTFGGTSIPTTHELQIRLKRPKTGKFGDETISSVIGAAKTRRQSDDNSTVHFDALGIDEHDELKVVVEYHGRKRIYNVTNLRRNLCTRHVPEDQIRREEGHGRFLVKRPLIVVL
mgnify:CR=1 FL=1